MGDWQTRQPDMRRQPIANPGLQPLVEWPSTTLARALLISTARWHDGFADECARITRAAAIDAFKVHTTTADPEAADVIVFFEPDDPYLASDVRGHPFAKRYPEKTFVFDPSDRIVPFLPGIYASIDRAHYDRSRVRGGFFPIVCDHHWIACDPSAAPPQLLFSFLGDVRGIPVREVLARIAHPRAVIRDTGTDPANADGLPAASYEHFHRQFAAVMANSAFTLCPRGAGTSTFRLFETMKAGRVPVILSDGWVPPEGPAWETFSIVVPERDAARVPEILESREHEAARMGRLAREQWESWFSERASFHRIVEWCLSILRSRRRPERLMRAVVLWQLLQPFNFRHKLVPGLRGVYQRRIRP